MEHANITLNQHLDKLLERAVERRSERLDVLVEINGKLSALGNTLRGEFEFLEYVLES
jgi:hypothetical protein